MLVDIDMNGNRLTNLGAPQSGSDAVRLVDLLASGGGGGGGGGGATGITELISDGLTTLAPSSNAVYDALLTKASTTALTAGLALKADATATTAALASKATPGDITTALGAYTNTTGMTSAIAAAVANRALTNLSNVTNADFVAKASAAGVGGGGGGGAVTSVNGSVGTVLIKAQNLGLAASPKDYGCVCDGVTDDTTAWNTMVAAVNAGTIRAIQLPPATIYLPGTTTTFTRGCSIVGYGSNSIISTTGNVTATVLNFSNIAITDFVVLSNFQMVAATQPKQRQAIQVTWATESAYFEITNIFIIGAFNKGIGMTNAVVGAFTNVHVNFYNYATNLWAWNVDATTGKYGTDLRWTSCSCWGVGIGWKGSGHLEGCVWLECVCPFVGYGWYIDCSDTTNTPEFKWTGGFCEAFQGGIYLNNAAFVQVSDLQVFPTAGAVTNFSCVWFNNVIHWNVHDCIFVGASSNVWHGVRASNAASYGQVHSNHFQILRGYGLWVETSSNYIDMYNNKFTVPQSGARPYADGWGASNNTIRSHSTDSTDVNFTRTGQSGFLAPTTGVANTSIAIAAQVAVPMLAGERYRVQAAVSCVSPTVALQQVSIRVREYTHRPSGAIPYSVFVVHNNRTSINDLRYLGQSPNPLGGGTAFYLDTEVRVIGTATDALMVLEVFTDNGSCSITEANIRVEAI